MKELSIKEKAKCYDKAFERAKEKYTTCYSPALLEYIFPKLKENKDKEIRKDIIRNLERYIKCMKDRYDAPSAKDFVKEIEKQIVWLEKQGDTNETINKDEFAQGVLKGAAINLITWIDYNATEGNMCLSNMECKDVEDALVSGDWDKIYAYIKKKLEKQNKNNKPLYIRFGDIPKDEKSKVYNGEIEIGIEKGVSVYPAFEDLEGNIVLGLSLPITKTSLYTQQHLLEYDNRACYLVSGDYVGKGTDGEPLLRNIKIIREIKDFRVKQDEQETLCDKCRKEQPSHSCQDITELGRCYVEHEQKSDNSYCQENCKGFQETGKCFADGDCKAKREAESTDRVEQSSINEIEIPFGAKDSELQEATYYIPKGFYAEMDDDKVVIKKGEKPTAWSKEDEKMFEYALNMIEWYSGKNEDKSRFVSDWLKSLKQRIGG